MEDLIERARAIEIIHELQDSQTIDQTADNAYDLVEWAISEIPSAQADTKELSFTHKALDTISRQAAIDALDKRFDSIPMEQTTEILLLRKDLRNLPAAQPEIVRCKECVNADENYHCDYMTTWNYGDCFCSYGKRRTDG